MLTHLHLRTLVLASAMAAVCLILTGNCEAQWRRYEPPSPTTSPYLNLTRLDNGGLPNYFALVRPQIQQRQINLQNQAQLRLQERQIIRLENEVQRGMNVAGATGSSSWFMVPGNSVKFLDTTQFYPAPNIPQRR